MRTQSSRAAAAPRAVRVKRDNARGALVRLHERLIAQVDARFAVLQVRKSQCRVQGDVVADQGKALPQQSRRPCRSRPAASASFRGVRAGSIRRPPRCPSSARRACCRSWFVRRTSRAVTIWRARRSWMTKTSSGRSFETLGPQWASVAASMSCAVTRSCAGGAAHAALEQVAPPPAGRRGRARPVSCRAALSDEVREMTRSAATRDSLLVTSSVSPSVK